MRTVTPPERLRATLASPRYRCRPITIGANTDAYQPAERSRKVTRAVLEVLADFRHPFSIITKSSLIERDIDLLADSAAANREWAVGVCTLDPASLESAGELERLASTFMCGG